MLASPLLQALAARRRPVPGLRRLSPDEVVRLKSQGNLWSETAELWAGPGFQADLVAGNRFVGRVVLDGQIYHSTLDDAELGPDCLVDRCPLIRRAWLGPGAVVRHSSLDCSAPTSFGLGSVMKAGLETPGREIALWDNLTLESAEHYLTDADLRTEVAALVAAVRFDRTVIEAGCEVINVGQVDRSYLGPACRLVGVSLVDECTLLSSSDEPVTLGTAVQVRQSVVQWGARLDTAAQVTRSALLEYSGAERQALVTESLLGPNTVAGGGEVTASFLGPFIGFHHQSLLIAAWWPEGRGNVGYGANIGSNHTSRSPDQELWAGEGTFFGLATAIKFPANFQEAPYSLIASGVVTLPQRLALPFSLVLDEPLDGPETRGLNRVIPGWVLRENAYLLLRNEHKYAERNRARRHAFDLRVFRPEIVEKLWKARVVLANTEGKPVYTKDHLPAVGKNYLLEEDRRQALDEYRHFLRYAALKLYAEDRLFGLPCDRAWLDGLLARLRLDTFSEAQNLHAYLHEERALLASSLKAKEKDDQRGAELIPAYRTFHRPADEDEFLTRKRRSLDELEEKIRQKTGSAS